MSLEQRRLLQGVLRRWSRSAEAGAFVLRGGLLTQLWVGAERRATQDIDFLGLFARDLGDTTARLESLLAVDGQDGVSYDLGTLQGEVIWEETAFPGHRFLLGACVDDNQLSLQIDVGFGDPLVPPSCWLDYPTLAGDTLRVQTVPAELLAAWKLDGLFDHGARRWPAKDLYDLHLLTTHCVLDFDILSESIRVAFAAHDDSLDEIPGVLFSSDWWLTEAAQAKWSKFRASAAVPVPESLLSVAKSVAEALRPALAPLVALPDEFA